MQLLAKLLKALNSDDSPWQLAFGVMLGMIMGLTPFLGLHSVLILFIVLFLRVNLSTFLLAYALFSGFTLILNPMMADIGESLLTSSDLNGMWTNLYNSTFGQLMQFYHTLTLGSLLFSLILAPFILVISKVLIVQYRVRFMQWVNKLKIVQVIKSSRVFQLYQALGE
ncbi:DUF2062 domain-containing protein [Paraglaciecola polaris]|uniref:DUF2062 domain-containing protein n=1 Tax=Paraglaciecola polaris LMG 21857 TaxID=1129793 RepID=K6Z6E8_9ALTE|nr:DUF2062 domain-containing protein [Paraglaciecola polaris]GAC31771.1 hypothetical protein GPLA_0855 [Paraglaciecola polaris LMG 21857]|tara:strand:- start:3131 stop:3634 length:504 start_codon:yes stop_codon:yes gene_type:complete